MFEFVGESLTSNHSNAGKLLSSNFCETCPFVPRGNNVINVNNAIH